MGSDGNVISGGKVLVMLAQPGAGCSSPGCVSNAPIEDIKMETTADPSTGAFFFCPVPAGTYDVIAIAVDGSNVTYAATITTGVQPGNALGHVKLIAAGAASTINGTVTTTTSTNNGAAIAEDVTVVPLQPITVGGTTVLVPIPQFGASTTITVTTVAPNPPSHTCPSSTVACNDYSLSVPAGNPSVGAFKPTGTTYAQAPAPVSYIVDGLASKCSPSEQQANSFNPTIASGVTSTAGTLAFAGCTP